MRNTAEDITWTGDENCEMLFLVFKTSHIAATFFSTWKTWLYFCFIIFNLLEKSENAEKRETNRFRIFLTKFLTGLVTTRVFNSTGAKGKNKTRFRIVGGAQLLSLSHAHTHTTSLSPDYFLSLSPSPKDARLQFSSALSLSRSLAPYTRAPCTYVRAGACVCVCVFSVWPDLLCTR